MEMAICLAVIGLMTGFGLRLAEAHNNDTCSRAMPDTIAAIQHALEQFEAAHSRYPLPASRQLGINHPAYGREVASATDPTIHRVLQTPPLIIGALPHATLGLPLELAQDCWGNQYTYAVTESFTTVSGYADGSVVGAIHVRSGTLSSWQSLTTEAAYIVFSHGSDALGASPASHNGTAITCNAAQADASITRIDKENCDTTNGIFYASPINTSASSSFFDDHVAYAVRPTLPPNSCASGTVTWGNCEGTALLTLLGLSVNVTNTKPGYTGLAVSTCNNGVRNTLGVCLPIGACVITSPRDGQPASMLTGTTINFGSGVCKTYKCCSGGVTISPLSPCALPLDLPGIGSCL